MLPETVFHALPFGNVKRDAHHAIRLSGCFKIHLPAGGYPSDASVGGYDPVVDQEALPGVKRLLHSMVDPFMILGMNYLEEAFIVQLLIRGEMKQLPGFFRNPDTTGVNIHAPQAGPRSIGRQT